MNVIVMATDEEIDAVYDQVIYAEFGLPRWWWRNLIGQAMTAAKIGDFDGRSPGEIRQILAATMDNVIATHAHTPGAIETWTAIKVRLLDAILANEPNEAFSDGETD